MPFTGEKEQGWARAFSYVHVKKMHFYNNIIGYFKSNGIVTNFSIIFLRVVDVVNSYWFVSEPTIYIIFLLINNHSLHQQFVKSLIIEQEI